MLLDFDGPEALDALGLGVVVAFVCVFIDFVDAEGEEGEREQLECVLGGGSVGDFGEEGVLGAGFLVGWRLESTDGTLDCGIVSDSSSRVILGIVMRHTFKHVLSLLVVYNRSWFQVLRLEPICDRNGFWFWWAGLDWLLLLLLLGALLRLHLRLLLCHGLLSQPLNILLNRNSMLLRFCGELLLDLSYLLGSRPFAVWSDRYGNRESFFLSGLALGWRPSLRLLAFCAHGEVWLCIC